MLVKFASNLDDAQIAEICVVCKKLPDGMICTNHGRRGRRPLRCSADRSRRRFCARCGSGWVPGIHWSASAAPPPPMMWGKLAKVDLVRIYASVPYEGPGIAPRLGAAVADERMKDECGR